MKLNLKIWRQENASAKGKMVDYQVDHIEPDMSFLEMLDILNDQLINNEHIPQIPSRQSWSKAIVSVPFSIN